MYVMPTNKNINIDKIVIDKIKISIINKKIFVTL